MERQGEDERHSRCCCQKIAVYLATDKRTWKVVGTIIGIAIAIVLLPVMLLLAMGNQLSSAETQSIDYSDYVQNLSAQQQSQLSQMESDGTAIADALTKLNLKNQIRESTDALSHLF